MSYGPNIGPTSSEPGTITMRAGGLVAKRREYLSRENRIQKGRVDKGRAEKSRAEKSIIADKRTI